MDRREFLKGAAGLLAAAKTAGCRSLTCGAGGSMQGFRCAPMKKIRVAFAGVGGRGTSAMYRIAKIPGCEVVALCDLRQSRMDVCNGWLKKNGYAPAKEFVGPEAYKAMCDLDDVDVVYVAGSWQMHEPVGIYAVNAGKHTLVEVPAAMTLDGCWAFVEVAEKSRVHCMMLENCCYGEAELLALNLVRRGKLGRLVHGEAAYIHDLRFMNYADAEGEPGDPKRGYWGHWRLEWNRLHKGNQYPTHGLGPVCQYMNVNRGDRLECLCSLESGQFNFEEYARKTFPPGDWHHDAKVAMGDMNSTLVRTANGRTILVQHDVSSPRPYTRLNRITGTLGIFEGSYFPEKSSEGATNALEGGAICRFGFGEKTGDHVHAFFDFDTAEKVRKEFCHPYFKKAGKIAAKVGGHGGNDFLMDLRWVYCMQNGLPMDMDVYDLATWCCLCELTERSVRERRYVDVPDFTCGGWRTAEPLGIVDIDLSKINLNGLGAGRAGEQMDHV